MQFYVPAWEGGHPDHDALNAATLIARKRINQEDIKIYQFSLYNAYRCRKPFFRVSYPLKKNGDVLIDIIPIKIDLNIYFAALIILLNGKRG